MKLQRQVTFYMHGYKDPIPPFSGANHEGARDVLVEALVTIEPSDGYCPPVEEVEDLYFSVDGVDVDPEEWEICELQAVERALEQALQDEGEDRAEIMAGMLTRCWYGL